MEAKVEPRPGQVWGWADLQPGEHLLVRPEYGKRPGEWVVRVDGRSTNDCCAFYGCETPEDQRGIAKRFIRWATPAECRAAGLDPDAVLPPAAEPTAETPKPERPEWVRITEIPTFYIPSEIKVGAVFRVTDWSSDGKPMVDFGNGNAWWLAGDKRVMGHSFPLWEPAPPPATQAPQNMAQAAIDAYEARIKALDTELRLARERIGEASDAMGAHGVPDGLTLTDGVEYLAGKHDTALRDAAEQRRRAEKADAALSMEREAHAIAKRNADYFEREYVSLLHRYTTNPTPAPTRGGQAPQLTPEDRAWMDAMQREQVRDLYGCVWPEVRAAAKAAIAARARRKGV